MRQLLLFPHDLPKTVGAARTAQSQDVLRLADALDRGNDSPAAILEILGGARLRPDGVKLDRWQSQLSSRRGDQYTVLDDYFGVSRTTAAAQQMFCHAAALAYRTMLEDSFKYGTELDHRQWNELRWGLETMVRFCTGSSPCPPADAPVPAGNRQRDPHRRWRTGHQLFFPLIQAVVVGLECFTAAILAGDEAAARESACFASDVMRASGRALEFAADFCPSSYTGAVRPSMTPPGTAQPLSGLMSADHHQMVLCFHQVRPLVPMLSAELRQLYDHFIEAVEGTYVAHRHVCARFRGDRVVSLRMSQTSSMTAADVVEQMGNARVKVLTPS